MTLATIVRRVADEVGLPRPNAVASSTDQLPRQMMALANSQLEELAELNWPILQYEHTFDTVVGQDTYDLPDDWARNMGETAYIASQYYQLRGSMSAADWARTKNTLPLPIGRYKYRVTGNPLKIVIVPTPQTVEHIVFEYISNQLVVGSDSTPKPLYTEDNDVSLIPGRLVRMGLKWRIKEAKGFDYAEDFNAFEASRDTLFAQMKDLGAIPVAHRNYADIPEIGDGYVPETGYGNGA